MNTPTENAVTKTSERVMVANATSASDAKYSTTMRQAP